MGSSPGWTYGYVPTAGEWNQQFASKQDDLGYIPVNRAGDTMAGKLSTFASTLADAGFSIQPGVAPTSPSDGDMWFTGAGMFFRANGVTIGPVSTGTVTSIGLTAPVQFSVSNSPVSGSGNLGLTWVNQTANRILAGPTSGGSAAPTFRALVGADLPNPSATTLGGVRSQAAIANQFMSGISTAGVPQMLQPSFNNISGVADVAQIPTGTSGLAVPLLNGANTWSAAQVYNSTVTASAGLIIGSPDASSNFYLDVSNAGTLPDFIGKFSNFGPAILMEDRTTSAQNSVERTDGNLWRIYSTPNNDGTSLTERMKLNLTNGNLTLSGFLDVASGGTGATDAATARTNLGLGNVDNTSDANKPVSTAQQTALNLKANLASPALTGNPTAPTQAAGNNSTRIATTAYVDTGLALKANLASPALTGTPTAPTATAGDNSTRVATTAYVDLAVSGGSGQFSSGQLTPVLGGLLSASHGLGAKPTYYSAFIRCLTAEGGWAVGDEVQVFPVALGGAGYGVQVYADTTTIYGRVGSGQLSAMFNKSSGAQFFPSVANWSVILRCRL